MAELFPFVELEFPFVLGPADGRYLVREAGGEGVLILHTAGAPRRRLLRGRRPRPVAEREAEAATVPVTRVTAVRAASLPGEGQAAAWLNRTAASAEDRERAVDEALALLNRALHVHRAATANPHVIEVTARQATAVRIGYGDGDRLAEGGWREARLLPQRPPRRRRVAQLRPQERLAAVLGGRERVAVCETLLLRARLDLDQGRPREAALQLRAGLEALLAELAGEPGGAEQAAELAVLGERRAAIEEAAGRALGGEPGDQGEALIREVMERCERVLRRRRLRSG